MDSEKIYVVLNEVIVNKINTISFDIKYYLNTNGCIAKSLSEDSRKAFKFMDDEDVNELIEIRKRLNNLASKLKQKVNA